MRTRWPGAVLVAAATVLAGPGAPPAGAAAPVVTSEPLRLVQDEAMCGGEEVPVTYEGASWTRGVPGGTGPGGSWSGFAARLSWQQGTVQYSALATGGFSLPPGGRSSTYHFLAAGRGSDGSRVLVVEVVHARRSADGTPVVVLDVERVSCR